MLHYERLYIGQILEHPGIDVKVILLLPTRCVWESY